MLLRSRMLPVLLSSLLTLLVCDLSAAATVPSGFTDTLIASGLAKPTAMAFAPDGRLFVCEQGGTLRIIKNNALLSTPFVSLTVSSLGERGLLGVTFDPNFATNKFVYVYYTATTPTIHNRVSRFTASGDVALAGSETILLDLETLGANNHNGGAIHFGPDGKLYVAVGENAVRFERAESEQPAREDAADQCGRIDSDGQPVLYDCIGSESRDLGARAAKSLYLRVSAAVRELSTSMMSGRIRGRKSISALPARITGGRPRKGRRPIHASEVPSTRTRTRRDARSQAVRSTIR